MKKMEVIMTNYSELEKIINKNINLPESFEICPSEEASNYSYKRFDVDGKYEEEDLIDLEAGDYMYKTEAVLNILCSRGIIEPGIYIVDMSW